MARDESRFDWDRHNIAHVAKHKVKPEEVEEVLSNNTVFIESEIDELSGEERLSETWAHKRGPDSVRGLDSTRETRSSRDGLRCRSEDSSVIHRCAIWER